MTHFRETRKRRIYLAIADHYERVRRDDPTAGIEDEQEESDNLTAELGDEND